MRQSSTGALNWSIGALQTIFYDQFLRTLELNLQFLIHGSLGVCFSLDLVTVRTSGQL